MSKSRKKRPSDALFEYACSLIAAEKFEASVSELEALRESYPDEIRVLIMLGGAYYENGQPVQAAACMETVVQQRPTLELSSLVLFHSLLDLGRKSDAIAEAHRFLAIAESTVYREVLADIEQADTA